MTLIQLRVFCAVVEQGSFRAAARALDIGQSTLTQAIQSLEAELGVTLLNRSHQGISVTSLGETFLIRANAIIRDCERAMQDMQQSSGNPKDRSRSVSRPSRWQNPCCRYSSVLLPAFRAYACMCPAAIRRC